MDTTITLRAVRDDDLEHFFEHQLDKTAQYMAAFISKDPNDRDAFDQHWTKIRSDSSIIIRTICQDEAIVGNIASFERFGDIEVTYWIDRDFWGKGIATEALRQFLEINTQRPIFGRVVKDNIGSRRVLEKCGFVIDGEDKGFANARDEEVEEYILKLE